MGGAVFVIAPKVLNMFNKIFLALVLTFGGALTASAQEFQYIGIQGSWWNPEYTGEGFSVEEYGDGYMIAYWYTYGEMGQQMWLIGTGEREGNTVTLEMRRTSGGVMADPSNGDNVMEEVWGTVTLQINDCGHMDMSYETITGETGGYPLSRLLSRPHAAGSCSAIEIPPEEEDPPVEEEPPGEEEPPPEEDPTPVVEVTLQKWIATGTWVDVEYPFTGLAVINKDYIGDPGRITLFRFRIVVEEGELIIGAVSASDPSGISQPSVEGILPGMSFPEGSEVMFSLDSNLTGGARVYPHYSVFAEGVGEIVNLTVRLSTQTL